MRSKVALWLAPFVLALVPVLTQAQTTGSIHGHVQDPAATPISGAQVKLSLDGKTTKYTFTTDQNGDYKGSDIVPDTYVAILYQTADKAVDRFLGVKITAGADTLQDFDLTRPSYIESLTPEQQKQIKELKSKNEQAIKENQGIKQVNGMLRDARAADQQRKFDEAEKIMQQAVAIKPDASVLWLELGIAQTGLKKYDDALTSLKKTLDLESTAKKPSVEVQAAANNTLGEVYGSTNKIPEASAAYDAAAKLLPAQAATYYTNETIILSRGGQTDPTVDAADKAIAADPTKPIPYYLKGQALIAKATVDPKTQKIVAPPGTVEAYQKYIELAPTGQFAEASKQVLAEIGATVTNKYSAPKKR